MFLGAFCQEDDHLCWDLMVQVPRQVIPGRALNLLLTQEEWLDKLPCGKKLVLYYPHGICSFTAAKHLQIKGFVIKQRHCAMER
jgi:hypothetical protein